MAHNLEQCLQRRVIHVVLRQSSAEPCTDVTVQFVSPTALDRTIRKLADDGYGVGPPPSPELVFAEGEEIVLRFRGNIVAASATGEGDDNGNDVDVGGDDVDNGTGRRRGELRTAFNSNVRTKFDLSVAVADRFAQRAIDCYRGFLQIYGIDRKAVATAVLAASRGGGRQSHSQQQQQQQRPNSAAASKPTGQSDESKSHGSGSTNRPMTISSTSGVELEEGERLLCELLVNIPKVCVTTSIRLLAFR